MTGTYPPTLLIHGTDDTDVPYRQSKDMAAKLAEAGVEHELITVTRRGSWPDGDRCRRTQADQRSGC